MQAALACSDPPVLHATSHALLARTDYTWLSWPEMLQAARRLLDMATVSGTGPEISALYGWDDARHLRVPVQRTRLASLTPLWARWNLSPPGAGFHPREW